MNENKELTAMQAVTLIIGIGSVLTWVFVGCSIDLFHLPLIGMLCMALHHAMQEEKHQ